jgi:hypothetical protein
VTGEELPDGVDAATDEYVDALSQMLVRDVLAAGEVWSQLAERARREPAVDLATSLWLRREQQKTAELLRQLGLDIPDEWDITQLTKDKE